MSHQLSRATDNPLPHPNFAAMQVHFELNRLPKFRNAVLTIGTFDGVHRGHQQILEALRQEARMVGGETVLITFDPHPRKIVQPDASLELLTTLAERATLLEAEGIDHLVVVPFTPTFAGQEAEAYVSDFLVGRFRPHTLIIGYDHRFGHNRNGGYELLEALQAHFGYRLVEIPQHVLHSITISSTKIRQALKNSAITKANELLGYPFFFDGKVVHGDKIGRTLGYPTANLAYTSADKIHVGEGVYSARAHYRGQILNGMLSIGKRPTLNDIVERVEINLFDFDGDLYDQELRIEVHHYLRAQEKYGSLENLKAQLHRDKSDALRLLSRA